MINKIIKKIFLLIALILYFNNYKGNVITKTAYPKYGSVIETSLVSAVF